MYAGKKFIFSLLLLMFFGFGTSKAQLAFHIEYDSLSNPMPDSGSYGDTFVVGFRIFNISTTPFNDRVAILMRTSQGTFQLGDSLLMSIPAAGNGVISALDTLSFARYGGGISIIVIWPTSPSFMDTDSIKDAIKILPLGIENGDSKDFDVLIFPNPTTDQLFFRRNKWFPIKETSLINSSGQVILRQDGLPVNLDLENLTAGFYYLRLLAPSGAVATFKVIRE
jgi:hypothetical protein